MVAPLTHFCLVFSFHNLFIILSHNLQNPHRKTVDCNKLCRPMIQGDAIATLTTNKTKPTGPSCLGGFVVSENLSN